MFGCSRTPKEDRRAAFLGKTPSKYIGRRSVTGFRESPVVIAIVIGNEHDATMKCLEGECPMTVAFDNSKARAMFPSVPRWERYFGVTEWVVFGRCLANHWDGNAPLLSPS